MADMNRRFGMTVVLTLGRNGALAWSTATPLHVDAAGRWSSTRPAPATRFAGAFAAALDRGASLPRTRLPTGVDAGALGLHARGRAARFLNGNARHAHPTR